MSQQAFNTYAIDICTTLPRQRGHRNPISPAANLTKTGKSQSGHEIFKIPNCLGSIRRAYAKIVLRTLLIKRPLTMKRVYKESLLGSQFFPKTLRISKNSF